MGLVDGFLLCFWDLGLFPHGSLLFLSLVYQLHYHGPNLLAANPVLELLDERKEPNPIVPIHDHLLIRQQAAHIPEESLDDRTGSLSQASRITGQADFQYPFT